MIATDLPRAQCDENARSCFFSMKAGNLPSADARANCGSTWEAAIQLVEQAFRKNSTVVAKLLDSMVESKIYPGLGELLQTEPVDQAEIDEPIAALNRQTTSLYAVPPLQPEAKANEDQAHQASPVLDAMIEFFRYWCTRSYEGYHEAVALWVLSVIAARRVFLPWRAGVWTPLYIMLVAKSTSHAKTEAAGAGRSIIEACGLDFLLSSDEITPQKLVSNMAGDVATLPRNYACLPPEKQEWIRLKTAFSGQQGWIYDEFGNKLQEIVKAKGPTAFLYALLKQLYDCKRRYNYETISRLGDQIEMPSLSVIGTATPACLKPIMGRDSALFTDGFNARIAFIVPPSDELKLTSAPLEQRIVPAEIIQPLRAWHDRLGTPFCEIVENELLEAAETDSKKKKKGEDTYSIQRGELPQNLVLMSKHVYKAHELYYASLAKLIHEHKLDERFSSNYGRLPDMALRIGMLLASLENDGHMDMRHWGRGQQITEHWRYNFHELICQLENSTDGYGALEQLILDVIAEQKNLLDARSISQKRAQLRSAGAPKVREICNELASAKVIGKQGSGKDALYGLKELVRS